MNTLIGQLTNDYLGAPPSCVGRVADQLSYMVGRHIRIETPAGRAFLPRARVIEICEPFLGNAVQRAQAYFDIKTRFYMSRREDTDIFSHELALWVAQSPGNELASRKKAALHIARAFIQSRVSLSLRNLGLTSLPPCLRFLDALRSLDVQDNKLSSLDFLSLPLGLEDITATRNRLTHIDKSVLRFPFLHMLDLRVNNITELPTHLGAIKTLKVLAISTNPLKTLPPSLWQCRLPDLPSISSTVIEPDTFSYATFREDTLESMVEAWQYFAKRTGPRIDVSVLDEEVQAHMFLFMKRLECAYDFREKLPKLFGQILDLIELMTKNTECAQKVAELAEDNNRACGDRTLSALLLIMGCARIYDETKNPIEGWLAWAKLNVFCNIVLELGSSQNENESTEIVLYLYSKMAKTLGLEETFFFGMNYPTTGERPWQDLVQDQFIALTDAQKLLCLPAWRDFLMKTYRNEYDKIRETSNDDVKLVEEKLLLLTERLLNDFECVRREALFG